MASLLGSAPVQSREVFLGIANQKLCRSGILSGSLARFQALKMLFEAQLGRDDGPRRVGRVGDVDARREARAPGAHRPVEDVAEERVHLAAHAIEAGEEARMLPVPRSASSHACAGPSGSATAPAGWTAGSAEAAGAGITEAAVVSAVANAANIFRTSAERILCEHAI